MTQLKRAAFLLCALIAFINGHTQQLPANTLPEVLKSLNSQKTANSKDILTTLFRANIDNLLGKEHSFTFNSSFFGIDSIFRGRNGKRPTYEEERKLRRNSFNLSITGDSANNIIKFSGGFTFTIINKKDIVYTKFEKSDSAFLTNTTRLQSKIARHLRKIMQTKHPELGTNKELNDEVNDTWKEAQRSGDYTKLHPFIAEVLNSPELLTEVVNDASIKSFTKEETVAATEMLLKGKNPLHEAFKSVAEKYARKPLWTFTPTAAYDRENSQGEYSFASEFTAGLGKNLDRKPWELEIKSQFKIAKDTSQKKTNYDNKPFYISVGLNKVMIESDENEPKMEFKFFTQYDYQFGKVAAGARAGVFTLNSTLRVNVFKSMWLPVTIKYDPKNNNFLGLFSVTANLGN